MIAGVCGGLAEYFDVDPTLIRVLFVVGIFLGGGILAYIILWIVVPEEPIIDFYQSAGTESGSPSGESSEANFSSVNIEPSVQDASNSRRLFLGVILILIGLSILIDNLFPQVDLSNYWPLILIGIGIGIIIKAKQG